MAILNIHPELALLLERQMRRVMDASGAGRDAWLSLQAKACDVLERVGLPDRKGEAYRYANLEDVLGRAYSEGNEVQADAGVLQNVFQDITLPKLDGYTVYLVNGQFCHAGGDDCFELEDGLLYGSIRRIAERYPQLLEQAQCDAMPDGLAAMATLMAEDGFFIHVPEGVQLEKPIQIVDFLCGDVDRAVASRNVISLGRGAKAQVVLCPVAGSLHKYFDHMRLDCRVDEQADLRFTLLQNVHDEVAQVLHLFGRTLGGARLQTNNLAIQGGFLRNNFYVSLLAPGAECHLNGLSLLDGSQYVDNHTLVEHCAPECSSSQLYKNLVDGAAESVFYGIIDVKPEAQKTIAYQRSASILLSECGKVRTRPQLVIHADDVKCSHGATVGQLDEDARFYLRSRGIPARAADRLLMSAFVSDVVNAVAPEPFREHVRQEVENRLEGEQNSYCINCPYRV